jgi:hypothetical protein
MDPISQTRATVENNMNHVIVISSVAISILLLLIITA